MSNTITTHTNSLYSKTQIKKILILGYNARPIACSAKRLGLHTYVIDYWGDIDLSLCADYIYIARENALHLSQNFRNLMINEAIRIIKTQQVDGVLVGSGFDDYYDLLSVLFDAHENVYINPPDVFRRARNLEHWQSIAKSLGISVPRTAVTTNEEYLKTVKDFNFTYPFVVKPMKTGGGHSIRLISSKQTLMDYAKKHKTFVIQEYIKGVPASTSILSTSKDAVLVSINRQIIGDSQLGCSNFTYCGNIVPYSFHSKIDEELEKKSIKMALKLRLIGSNGFDWVISKDSPYLIEINPRFQGTLECIEKISYLNLVESHIETFYNKLPEKISFHSVAVKLIPFAKRTCKVLHFSKISNIYDIPRSGIIIEKGHPICTVISIHKNRDIALKNAWNVVDVVYKTLIDET